MKVTLVPKDRQHFWYERVMKVLGPAVKKSGGRWTIGDLLKALSDGRQQLWFAYDDDNEIKGMLTTAIQQYPQGQMLEIVFAGGTDVKEWLTESFDIFKRYAKDVGCIGVEGRARKGFEPLFIKAGYKKPQAMYEYLFERKA